MLFYFEYFLDLEKLLLMNREKNEFCDSLVFFNIKVLNLLYFIVIINKFSKRTE